MAGVECWPRDFPGSILHDERSTALRIYHVEHFRGGQLMSSFLAEKHLFHLLLQALKQVFSLASPPCRAVPCGVVTYGPAPGIGALSQQPPQLSDELLQGKSEKMKHLTGALC